MSSSESSGRRCLATKEELAQIRGTRNAALDEPKRHSQAMRAAIPQAARTSGRTSAPDKAAVSLDFDIAEDDDCRMACHNAARRHVPGHDAACCHGGPIADLDARQDTASGADEAACPMRFCSDARRAVWWREWRHRTRYTSRLRHGPCRKGLVEANAQGKFRVGWTPSPRRASDRAAEGQR